MFLCGRLRGGEAACRSHAVSPLQALICTKGGGLAPTTASRSHGMPLGARAADDFREAPDIAIEIASPEQSVTALVRRCLWYVRHGVQVALLVDPADKSVLAFRPDQPAIAWHGADRIDLHKVLPDFDYTVEQLFASLRRV